MFNSWEKVLVKCPNPNHEPYEVRFSAFKNQNQRCEKCSKEIASEKRKHSYNFVKEFIEFYGYKAIWNINSRSLEIIIYIDISLLYIILNTNIVVFSKKNENDHLYKNLLILS